MSGLWLVMTLFDYGGHTADCLHTLTSQGYSGISRCGAWTVTGVSQVVLTSSILLFYQELPLVFLLPFQVPASPLHACQENVQMSEDK